MRNSILLNCSLEELKQLLNEVAPAPIIQHTETFLSKKEACDLLGITLNTLSKFVKNNTIPAFGIGSRILFKRSDLEKSLLLIN